MGGFQALAAGGQDSAEDGSDLFRAGDIFAQDDIGGAAVRVRQARRGGDEVVRPRWFLAGVRGAGEHGAGANESLDVGVRGAEGAEGVRDGAGVGGDGAGGLVQSGSLIVFSLGAADPFREGFQQALQVGEGGVPRVSG